MRRVLGLSSVLLTLSSPALGQRADENAVRAAGDAFGTSVGNEKIGLYGATDVRGFSPILAGNIRVEGLSLTEHGGFNSRVVSRSTIRVGLTAQGYPFPAPTGIADYSLRTSGNEAVLSPILYLGPNGTAAMDIDAQIPIVRDRLSLAAGVTYRFDEPFPQEGASSLQLGGVLRWRPRDGIEIMPFYGRTKIVDDRTIGAIFTGGPYLPPRVERRYNGLEWTESQGERQFFGAVGSAQLTDRWRVRAGLFRWEDEQKLGFSEQYLSVQRDGSARRQLVVTKGQTARSTSGEVRSSHTVVGEKRQHTVHFAVRGRDTQRAYGGENVRDLGVANIGAPTNVQQPEFRFGPLARDSITQVTGGIGYEGRWQGVGELSLGIQKTNYRKDTRLPGRPTLTTKDGPWLYNATLALQLTDRLVAYAGYTSGLEESGVAPANAVNRNAATPALTTSQRDAGIRYALTEQLSFVAGVFDVRKPYFNLDPSFVFRELGTVRHRGVELSFAGQPVNGLSVVAGAVLLDAEVAGEAVDRGSIGRRPIGTTARTVRVNFDYRLPAFQPLSIDLAVTDQAGEIASFNGFSELGGRQLSTEDRTLVDIGARYRFKLASAPATLRFQVTNLFNVYAWKAGGNSALRFVDARRFLLTLAADF